MGLFDKIVKSVEDASNKAAKEVEKAINRKTTSFDTMPESLDALKKLPQAQLKSPADAATCTIIALVTFADNQKVRTEMLNYLKGPVPLSNQEISFLNDRLKGKKYVAMSYFEGTSPSNNYSPSKPYKVVTEENQYTYQEDGYARILMKSSGADSSRPIKFRKKGDQWFLFGDITIVGDVRIPDNADPWK